MNTVRTIKLIILLSLKTKPIKKMFLILIILSMRVCGQNTQVTWYSFSSGFGEPAAANISLKSIIGDLVVGTSSNGVSSISGGFFSNPASTGIITGLNEKVSESVPASFRLNQNFPNPFNPSTNIKFSLPQQSTVKIVIYDLLGREVKTLINDVKPAGIYTVRWNGENESNVNVGSGIYFYCLYASGADNQKFTSFKKMILLK
ncbi:MAG: T9SS type A sorting domain-containing protein [Ignavibacteriaceae bacterium]